MSREVVKWPCQLIKVIEELTDHQSLLPPVVVSHVGMSSMASNVVIKKIDVAVNFTGMSPLF
eukprot:3177564-Ditylum_brightwellii.AAC.1